MIPATINNDDKIVLNSVESYLISRQLPPAIDPQEKIMIRRQAKEYLYSQIAIRFARISSYILSSDLESNDMAQGLSLSLSKHMMDPLFINILMNHLLTTNNSEENLISGAMLSKLASKWLEVNIESQENPNKATTTANVATKSKKDSDDKTADKVTTPTIKEEKHDKSEIDHVIKAINALLEKLSKIVIDKCPNIREGQAITVAASIALTSEQTIIELIESDYPITANVLDIYLSDNNVMSKMICDILRMEATKIPGKLTTNQSAFVESVKRWLYKALNDLNPQQIYQFLIAAYGSPRVSSNVVETKFINPKSCGNQYPSLLEVAKLVINN